MLLAHNALMLSGKGLSQSVQAAEAGTAPSSTETEAAFERQCNECIWEEPT